MVYQIEFYRQGRLLETHTWTATLGTSIEHAQTNMRLRDADFSRVVRFGDGGGEVWSQWGGT